jgi:hypothetical protein
MFKDKYKWLESIIAFLEPLDSKILPYCKELVKDKLIY